MTVIVTDTGFAPEHWRGPLPALADLESTPAEGAVGVTLSPTDDPTALAARIGRIDLIRILFPAFNDGRGFTLARRLRAMGYQGRLRAAGHVIADQYAMVRRSGFDEVEISDDLASRQPQDHWLRRANWRAHDYQARLRA